MGKGLTHLDGSHQQVTVMRETGSERRTVVEGVVRPVLRLRLADRLLELQSEEGQLVSRG